MKHLTIHRVSALHLPMSHVRQIARINETKGKQELYRVQKPELLEALRNVAVIHSTESSNRIENVQVDEHRLRDLLTRDAEPRNRDESEVAGYRDVLRSIHESWRYMPVSPNLILQLHRDLYGFTAQPGGRWKLVDNEIRETLPDGTTRPRFAGTTPAHQTAETMAALCGTFLRLRQAGEADDLILVGTFVLDFLCIHPFADGNGRLARLMTLLLLYQAGYEIGKYISLERVIEESKASYYDALLASSRGWPGGENDPLPWLSYFLGFLTKACTGLDDRMEQATRLGGGLGAKTTLVRQAINNLREPFTSEDVVRACPAVSPHTIRKVMDEMRREGALRLLHRGRNAQWMRAAPTTEPERS